VVVVIELQELSAGELGPLSVMMEFGTPDLWMMSVKNDTACSDLRLVMGRASIHFENLSTTTSRCLYLSGAFRKGPTMSNPHTANDHVTGMVWRA
jgi:hypothetical protein